MSASVAVMTWNPRKFAKLSAISGTAISQHSFTSTNIKLSKGDQVFIIATGTVSMTPWGNNAQSTPEGSPNFGTVGPGIFGGTLIGKLGDSGSQVKVGSNYKFSSPPIVPASSNSALPAPATTRATHFPASTK